MDSTFTFTNPELNPWLLTVDIALIFHALWSYWYYCLRLGFKLDIWHLNLLLSFVLPMMVNFIFAGATENRISVWNAVSEIQTTIDHAFLIQLSGYLCFHAGFYFYNATKKRKSALREIVSAPVEWMAGSYERLVNSPAWMITLLVPTLAGGVYLLQQAGGGIRFDLRNLIMGDGTARPIYGFCFQAAGPLLLTAGWARFIRQRTWLNLALALLMVFFEILSGTRSAIILPLGTLAAVYAITQGRKLKFSFVLTAAVVMLSLGLSLSIARTESVAKTVVRHDAVKEFAYGNEYSDLRDFAWLLYKWDGQFALGRTYIAGALGFIPRAIFFTEFREVWGFGPYSGNFVGLSANHPGIRTGFFGEPFLNFGYFGVVLVGFIGGYMVRYIDDGIKTRVRKGHVDMVSAVSVAQGMLLVHNLAFSTATWALYSVLLISLGVRLFSRRTRNRRLVNFSGAELSPAQLKPF